MTQTRGVTGRGVTTATRPWCREGEGVESGDAEWMLVVNFVVAVPLMVDAFLCVVLFFPGACRVKCS